MKSGNMNTIVSEKAIPRSALQVWKEEIIFSSLKPWRIWSRFSHKKHPLPACKVKKIKSYQENDKKSIFSEVNKVAKSCLMESGLIAQSIKKGDEELWSIRLILPRSRANISIIKPKTQIQIWQLSGHGYQHPRRPWYFGKCSDCISAYSCEDWSIS